jgi:phenylacetic acid degradation operon negative regulatory protein
MKARTEEFLYLLLWTAEGLARPTWRNAVGSFEGWAYGNGTLRQMQRLEAQKLLETRRGGSDKRLIRLTKRGRLRALGGMDPPERWNRSWDGKWRLVLFDLPSEHEALRTRLRRFFQAHRFGNLQRSVWVTPDDLKEFRKLFHGDNQVKTFVCLESVPCGGERNVDIVMGGWDWNYINALYEGHRQVLSRFPVDGSRAFLAPEALIEWAREEHAAWKEATEADPFLPAPLLPQGYLGHRAWKERIRILGKAGKALIACDK